jgi:2'-5' RNA ligase
MESGGKLERLAAGVRARVDMVAPDGPQDHKPFRAHLTLARIKRPLPAAKRQLLRQIQLAANESLLVSDFRLIRSELRPSGPLYTVLARYSLAEGR